MSRHRFTIPPSSTIKIEGSGNTVMVKAFTASPGEPGASAYQIEVAHGYGGSEAEWIADQPAFFNVDLVTIYNTSKEII